MSDSQSAPPEFISTDLNTGHDLTQFECGEPALDEWLHNRARRDASAGVCRVKVWTPRDDLDRVVAFYTIAATQCVRDDGLTRRLHAGYSTVPAFLLGRLAVDIHWQGSGIGTDVLGDALVLMVEAARVGGARLIVVDPISAEVASWYRNLGFQRAGARSGPEPARPNRLYMTVQDAEAAIEAADRPELNRLNK